MCFKLPWTLLFIINAIVLAYLYKPNYCNYLYNNYFTIIKYYFTIIKQCFENYLKHVIDCYENPSREVCIDQFTTTLLG